MAESIDTKDWTLIIKPNSSPFKIDLKEIWRYRDLVMLFVKRDFVSLYKQTILGPLWFFIQPILTTVTFVIIFGNVAQISTDGYPQILFYLSGITLWNYFSECINKTASVFIDNASVFGKVYFPRLTVPLSIIISNLLKFLIQFSLFISVWIYFYIQGKIHPDIKLIVLITPLLIIISGTLALGTGIIISSLTTKYRDLRFLITFGVQLLMYASPIVYPLSVIKGTKYELLILANPMTPVIEIFKNIYLGGDILNMKYLAYSGVVTVIILFVGVLIFNKVEKTFMDTI